ncbi:MAG: homocysteine S-methyltransferase [Gammaproteobacteria bacterium]|nr:homocysteine S-methyltransferase [Gammaproteobacteria bacterium]
MNPLTPFLQQQGFVMLDGGLSTQLERLGADITGELWTFRVLLEQPELLERAHAAFLDGGADIVATASYQASIEGLQRAGYSAGDAKRLMRHSVAIAARARDAYWSRARDGGGRLCPLVATSLGPYGACLHDGSEYHGKYTLTRAELADFHRRRIAILSDAGADLFAFETFPSLAEAEALLDVLPEFPKLRAWLSFTCRDEKKVAHGEPFAECAALATSCENLVAVGINCLDPLKVPALLDTAAGCGLPLMAYPNSGEYWDADAQEWRGDPRKHMNVAAWRRHGARLIGGCCRTDADDIRQMRGALENTFRSGMEKHGAE